ncbi:MAG: MoaD/ThiS family protein [Desulfohalobiaceae bacterium]|nr:MoaD/ThiS family protein [Desulfohalobiaceae bacterium]
MIRVKDRHITWHEGMTVADMLRELGDGFPYAAALINDRYVCRRDFPTALIPDKAEIILIPGVGGG